MRKAAAITFPPDRRRLVRDGVVWLERVPIMACNSFVLRGAFSDIDFAAADRWRIRGDELRARRRDADARRDRYVGLFPNFSGFVDCGRRNSGKGSRVMVSCRAKRFLDLTPLDLDRLGFRDASDVANYWRSRGWWRTRGPNPWAWEILLGG